MTGAQVVHVFLLHFERCDRTTVYAPQAVIHPRRHISRGAVKMLYEFQSSATFTNHDVLLVEHVRKRLDLTVRIFLMLCLWVKRVWSELLSLEEL
jgi:hypothetical protein